MCNGDDGAFVLGEVALKPADRFGIEVVGRLVQQQQVGCRQQQAAQRHAPALAAGERRHIGVAWRQSQRVHRVLQLGVEAPRVGCVDLCLQLAELLGGLVGVVGCEFVEAVEQGARFGDSHFDVALDVLLGIELRLLLEQAYAGAGSQIGIAAVVIVVAGHDLQDARLARAVVTEHADLGARIERKRNIAEHGLIRRISLGQLVHREDVLVSHRAKR
uniref:Unannotated protein n=1 Tax=freshwater metagenome TaxID=449393 RepID=A0A6J5ZXT5_9ZZZZ